MQSAFLGLVAAVESFDPAGGYSFLTGLSIHLKTAFNDACGVRYERLAKDPLHNALSLDAPINAEDPDGATLGDLQPAADDMAEGVEDQVFNEQLRQAIEKLLSRLPQAAADVIRASYLDGEPSAKIAARYGMTVKNLASSRNGYLTQLRVASRTTPEGAQLRRFIEDRTDYYLTIGPDSFHRRHTSAVEALAMRREDLEKIFGRVEKNV